MSVDLTLSEDIAARARRLSPLDELPSRVCDELLARSSTLLELSIGDYIYTQGQQDDFVCYLLHGRVQRVVDGVTLDSLDGDREERNRPLDQSARKRDTVRALSPVTILRLNRGDLERAHQTTRDAAGTSSLEVMDIASDASNDWWTRLLSSDIFLRLSAPVIHGLFDRLEEVSVQAGQDVVKQGEPGDYYYVVQSGTCQVVRRVGDGHGEVQLASLGPGEAFGEEALVAGVPRNATVRMTTAGKLMRLGKADFMELVVTPLVSGVSVSQGRWLVEQGGGWIDVRDAQDPTVPELTGAMKVPLYMLRAHSARLDRNSSYVVFGDTVRMGMLAAFLLAARGFDSSYLEEPLPVPSSADVPEQRHRTNGTSIPEVNRMNDEKENRESMIERAGGEFGEPAASDPDDGRVARDAMGETTTGAELANLIDELYRQREELDEVTALDQPPARPPVAAKDPGAQPLRAPRGTSAGGIVGGILEDVQSNISGYLAEFMETQRGALEQRVEQRLAALELAAREQVEAREKALRASFEKAFAEKEQGLAEGYNRLTSLANRIGQQKADIQKARKALESMLRTASRVHREVYRVGNALASQIDHLDDFTEELKLH